MRAGAQRHRAALGHTGSPQHINASARCRPRIRRARRNVLSPLDHDRRDFETKHASGGLCLAHFDHGLGIAKVEHDSQSAQLRDKLAREF
jgi:hypothetical protein